MHLFSKKNDYICTAFERKPLQCKVLQEKFNAQVVELVDTLL